MVTTETELISMLILGTIHVHGFVTVHANGFHVIHQKPKHIQNGIYEAK